MVGYSAGFEPATRNLKLEPRSFFYLAPKPLAQKPDFRFRVAGEFKVENSFVNLKFSFYEKFHLLEPRSIVLDVPMLPRTFVKL